MDRLESGKLSLGVGHMGQERVTSVCEYGDNMYMYEDVIFIPYAGVMDQERTLSMSLHLSPSWKQCEQHLSLVMNCALDYRADLSFFKVFFYKYFCHRKEKCYYLKHRRIWQAMRQIR